MYFLNCPQRRQHLLSRRVPSGEQAAKGAHHNRKHDSGEHDGRGHGQVEIGLAERSKVTDTRGGAVQWQYQQAAEGPA